MRSVIIKLPRKFEDKGFKNFIPRNSMEENLKNALIKFSKEEKHKSLVLLGNYGTGKTHLAVSVMKNIPPVLRKIPISRSNENGVENQKYINRLERATCTFLVVDEFFQELNDCIIERHSKEALIKNYLNTNDIVCLDDLRTENFTPAKAENLYMFVNRAYLDEKRIIVTTNFSMEQLESKEPRVASRLAEMSLLIQFNGQDYRKL